MGCQKVVQVFRHPPFFIATFEYENFAVCYESGINSVSRFDAHLQVYGANKRLKLEYDTPYTKGLPVKVVVDEKTASGGYQSRGILTTYEDAYTSELKGLYACLTEGKEIKMSIEDAIEDLQIFQMILKCAFPLKA